MFPSKWPIFRDKFSLKICYLLRASNHEETSQLTNFTEYQIVIYQLGALKSHRSAHTTHPMFISALNHIDNYWEDVSGDTSYTFRFEM